MHRPWSEGCSGPPDGTLRLSLGSGPRLSRGNPRLRRIGPASRGSSSGLPRRAPTSSRRRGDGRSARALPGAGPPPRGPGRPGPSVASASGSLSRRLSHSRSEGPAWPRRRPSRRSRIPFHRRRGIRRTADKTASSRRGSAGTRGGVRVLRVCIDDRTSRTSSPPCPSRRHRSDRSGPGHLPRRRTLRSDPTAPSRSRLRIPRRRTDTIPPRSRRTTRSSGKGRADPRRPVLARPRATRGACRHRRTSLPRPRTVPRGLRREAVPAKGIARRAGGPSPRRVPEVRSATRDSSRPSSSAGPSAT